MVSISEKDGKNQTDNAVACSEGWEVDAPVHPCSIANEIGALVFISSMIILHEKDCNVSLHYLSKLTLKPVST